MKHKNVFLRNYKGLDRYIANDFKHLGFSPSDTASYISFLDSHITQRPLFYITQVFVNTINQKLFSHNLKILIKNDGFEIQTFE